MGLNVFWMNRLRCRPDIVTRLVFTVLVIWLIMRLVCAASFLGGRCLVEVAGLAGRGYRWLALISRSAQLLIGSGGLHVFRLRGDRRDMMLARGSFLLAGSAGVYAAISTVVTDSSVVMNAYVFVVDVVDDRNINVVHGTIVVIVSVVPASAVVTASAISVSVIDPAIKADARTPITFME